MEGRCLFVDCPGDAVGDKIEKFLGLHGGIVVADGGSEDLGVLGLVGPDNWILSLPIVSSREDVGSEHFLNVVEFALRRLPAVGEIF